MKLLSRKKFGISAMTVIEMSVAMGIGTAILAGFTVASVAFQRSFAAVEDYSKGLNDQMRISDYLAMDMRRAFIITPATDATTGFLTVTLTLPNFYASANTPNDPKIVKNTGWPYKKHHHHKHKSVILTETPEYGTTTTQSVVYVFDNNASRLYRCVNGATPPSNPQAMDPAGVTTIARDVADFNVTVNALDETATTQIKFKPRFRSLAGNVTASNSTDAGIVGTTYFQTTLTRNTR